MFLALKDKKPYLPFNSNIIRKNINRINNPYSYIIRKRRSYFYVSVRDRYQLQYRSTRAMISPLFYSQLRCFSRITSHKNVYRLRRYSTNIFYFSFPFSLLLSTNLSTSNFFLIHHISTFYYCPVKSALHHTPTIFEPLLAIMLCLVIPTITATNCNLHNTQKIRKLMGNQQHKEVYFPKECGK